MSVDGGIAAFKACTGSPQLRHALGQTRICSTDHPPSSHICSKVVDFWLRCGTIAPALPIRTSGHGNIGQIRCEGEHTVPGPFDKMFCLVGDNPLPVYMGIKQLATPEAEIVLVYSEATTPQAKNIKELLDKARATSGNRGRTYIMNQGVQLRDPFPPRQVRETLDAVVARLTPHGPMLSIIPVTPTGPHRQCRPAG